MEIKQALKELLFHAYVNVEVPYFYKAYENKSFNPETLKQLLDMEELLINHIKLVTTDYYNSTLGLF